jgi:putative ABC transport system substrate-binding protein
LFKAARPPSIWRIWRFEQRLHAASTTRAFVDAGGLMPYGADGPALLRLSAKFVHRILQGGQPNDLPIEQPTNFELAVNLKGAKQIGLSIPDFGHRLCTSAMV